MVTKVTDLAHRILDIHTERGNLTKDELASLLSGETISTQRKLAVLATIGKFNYQNNHKSQRASETEFSDLYIQNVSNEQLLEYVYKVQSFLNTGLEMASLANVNPDNIRISL